jgi:DNA invertase Pin-like site-specific DNA recombinase
MIMAIQHAAIYTRVSKDDNSQDVMNQLRQLREYCLKQGWEVIYEYVDFMSGKRSDNRAQFRAMMKAASQRRFDVLAVWALDRLTREGIWQTFDHVRKLKSYGVEFESFQEPHFRTTGPAGDLLLAVAAWVAEQERQRIVERTNAGIARAKAQGKHCGRPFKIVNRPAVMAAYNQLRSMRKVAAQFKISPELARRIVNAAGEMRRQ